MWAAIDALDNEAPAETQRQLYLEARRLLDRVTRWLVQNRGGEIDIAAEIGRFRPAVEELMPAIPQMLLGAEQERLDTRANAFMEGGAPQDLAVQVASMLDAFSLLDIVEVAQRTDRSPAAVAPLYYALSERYDVDRLLVRITRLPRDDRWQALARAALRSDLYAALAGLTEQVLAVATPGAAPGEQINEWEAKYASALSRTRATLDEIAALEQFDVATLSVALRAMRTLVSSVS